ncbi:myeloid leukemia factor 2-like [Limulus polyphemus]|uniref:Myeloid leukemia factor 2-like n=1 Tax=Limulus polyphemus TaxID=6850 RepID=A0ABM1BVQ4_LIMPO|nr:myeloid leukemia factor 2-like [Limulus polyphemus]
MSIFSAAMRDFHQDSDMSGVFERMRQMDNMMTDFMAPFNSLFNGSMFPQLMGTNFRSDQDRTNRSLLPSVFGSSVFPNMDNLFSNYELMAQNPNTHCYSSSSVMSYSTDKTGRPQIYQASASTRTGPGGIKETQRSVHDSRSGLQKLAIGHHLGEKAHILEKSKNRNTGKEEENEELMNLDEDELVAFNRQWQQCAQPYNWQSRHAQLSDRDHHHHQYNRNSNPFAASQQLAITAGPSSTEHEQLRSPCQHGFESLSRKRHSVNSKQKKKLWNDHGKSKH